MTFQGADDTSVRIKKMMMGSHDACVDYSMPLGLNFLASMGDHYSPNPAKRVSYHRADSKGLGFDRTRQGSNYVGQYHPELAEIFNDRGKVPMDYLLWFHHVSWHEKLSTGRTLWEELDFRYDRGVAYVDEMVETWKTFEGKIAPEVHASVTKKLLKEKAFAKQWRDECIRYFSEFAKNGAVE